METQTREHPTVDELPTLGLVGVTLSLAACGGGGSSGGSAGTEPTVPPPVIPVPVPVTANEASRFLQQAQFSASEADIAAVRAKGYKTWLTEQFAAPATTTGFAWLDARGYNQVDLDGSEKRDASGNRIETYTQADITNIARVRLWPHPAIQW